LSDTSPAADTTCPLGFQDPATALDPYPMYARLRDAEPVCWDESVQAWFITRYADVHELLVDRRLGARATGGSVASLPPRARARAEAVERFLGKWMVFSDAPYQARVREIIAPVFSPAAVAGLDRPLRERALAAAGRFPDGGDLIADLSKPYALAVIGDVLGVTPAELGDLDVQARAVMDYLSSRADAAVAERAAAAVDALVRYVADTVLPRAEGPVGGRLAGAVRRRAMTVEEAAATFTQLLTGGVEPVSVAIAVCVLTLHAEQRTLSLVRSGEIPWSAAVEEALRYDSPFHFAPRRVLEGFTFRGRPLRRGQRVALVLASANRDERRFAAPQAFDPVRGAGGHLAFGRGGHYCAGAALARAEIRTLMQCLHERLPRLRPAAPAVRAPAFGATVLRSAPAFI
jgi:cytochrome P450